MTIPGVGPIGAKIIVDHRNLVVIPAIHEARITGQSRLEPHRRSARRSGEPRFERARDEGVLARARCRERRRSAAYEPGAHRPARMLQKKITRLGIATALVSRLAGSCLSPGGVLRRTLPRTNRSSAASCKRIDKVRPPILRPARVSCVSRMAQPASMAAATINASKILNPCSAASLIAAAWVAAGNLLAGTGRRQLGGRSFSRNPRSNLLNLAHTVRLDPPATALSADS